MPVRACIVLAEEGRLTCYRVDMDRGLSEMGKASWALTRMHLFISVPDVDNMTTALSFCCINYLL